MDLRRIGVVLPALVAAAAYDCFFETSDGIIYDLSPLTHTSPPDYTAIGQTDGYEYRSNVCKPVFQSCGGDFTGIATQWNQGGSCVAILGRENPEFGGLNRPELEYIDEDAPEAGVTLTYKNGDLCSYLITFEREVRYNIRCDKSTKAELVSVSEPQTCVYLFEYKSKAGCIPGSQAAKVKDSPRRRWTVKKTLLWMTVAFAVYCGVGMVYNRRKHGTEWVDSIPNKDFWVSLPEVLREGLGSTVAKLRTMKPNSMQDDRVPL